MGNKVYFMIYQLNFFLDRSGVEENSGWNTVSSSLEEPQWIVQEDQGSQSVEEREELDRDESWKSADWPTQVIQTADYTCM